MLFPVEELEKLVNSLKIMKSISIINSVLWDLNRKKKVLCDAKNFGTNIQDYDKVQEYLSERIQFWKINREKLFNKIKIIQECNNYLFD